MSDELKRMLPVIIIAVAFLASSAFYAISTRYVHVRDYVILDKWTGKTFKSIPEKRR